jgi:hypothetical protein
MRRSLIAGLLAAVALLVGAAPALAVAPPEWKLTVTPSADYFLPGTETGQAVYTLEAENVGGEPTDDSLPITLEDHLPTGLTAVGVQFRSTATGYFGPDLAVSPGLCPSDTRCKYPGALGLSAPPVAPGEKLVMLVRVAVPAEGLSGPILDKAKVTGGGTPLAVEATATNTVSAEPVIGLPDFSASLGDSSGLPYAEAGGHPYQLGVDYHFATFAEKDSGTSWGFSGVLPAHDPKDIAAELPAGLIGNPQAVPTCSLADFFASECALKTVVGTVAVAAFHGNDQTAFNFIVPLFNLQPTGAFPGELGYQIGFPFLISAGLRSGSDYGLTTTGAGTGEALVTRVRVTTWGIPADPSHDGVRGKICENLQWDHEYRSAAELEAICQTEPDPAGFQGGPAGTPEVPFLRMPTQCSGAPLSLRGSYNSWQEPSEYAEASEEFEPVVGCNQVNFGPTIEAHPTTNRADSPSGLEFALHVPQGCWKEEESAAFEPSCQSDLSAALVRLPAGLSVNPASASGLTGCSPTQIGLKTAVGQTPAHFSETSAQCPDAAKIGTVQVHTPLLHNTLEGSVYLATPRQNPFESFLAAYIVLEGEGLIIKLPGRIETDPQTGQITGKFLENPQTPFEDFRLHFFGGARGDLRTPAVCGGYETAATLTPYSAPESGPPAEPTSKFEVSEGPAGGGCPTSAAAQPNNPTFVAGTESPLGGAFTPFSLRLGREDGSQEISKIETTLPPGLTAKLAGVAECSDAQIALAQSREHEGGGAEEKASPSCPAASEVGTVEVASGAGPTPLYVTGRAYLAGPYKGAPLSLAIITPAVAGPFDLGDVVVRTALYTAPYTAQIKAISDPIPHILAGIPLDVRSITLKMARPNFTLNPTDCEEMGFAGAETSLLGNVAPLAQRFQVGGCKALPFKPKLKISLKGGTKRHTFPALTATLTMPPGQANIAKAQVTLPHSEQLEQAHITSQVCTQPQLATQTCPKASIYGYAKAETPLLDHPLEGPVYLGVGFGHKLPDLVAELNGQIRVLLHGKVDTGREDGLRNTFEVVPDAPVSKFTLHMFGGKKSLIVNSQNLCAPRTKRKALAFFTAQSGKVVELEPTVANSCKKKGKGHKKGGAK